MPLGLGPRDSSVLALVPYLAMPLIGTCTWSCPCLGLGPPCLAMPLGLGPRNTLACPWASGPVTHWPCPWASGPVTALFRPWSPIWPCP